MDSMLQYIIKFYGEGINIECLKNILLSEDMEFVIHKGQDYWARYIIEKYNKIKESDQLWYWTNEWQAGEKEATADIKNGRYTKCNSIEEVNKFLDSLKKGEK